MQQQIDEFATFKHEVPSPRTPSKSLVLPATPIPATFAQPMPTNGSERLHRERYDAVLVTYKPRAFRYAITFALFSWLFLLLGVLVLLFAVWRYIP